MHSSASSAEIPTASWPVWLPLLKVPYRNLFGSRSVWDLRLDDGQPVRIERGPHDAGSYVYRVRFGTFVYCCKFLVADERKRSCREWVALEALHREGCGVAATPVAYAPEGPLAQPVIVTLWLGGSPLTDTALTERDLTDLIDAMWRIHQLAARANYSFETAWRQPVGFRAYLVEIENQLQRIESWAANPLVADLLPPWAADLQSLLAPIRESVALAQARVKAAPPLGEEGVRRLVRLDGNLDNVVRDEEGGIRFLDWTCSGLGDPAFDLAELSWNPKSHFVPRPYWEAALANYSPPREDPAFIERLAVYGQLLPAWWITRSALLLLEGAGLIPGQRRLAPIPKRLYRRVRYQLDHYLATLGLAEPPAIEPKGE